MAPERLLMLARPEPVSTPRLPGLAPRIPQHRRLHGPQGRARAQGPLLGGPASASCPRGPAPWLPQPQRLLWRGLVRREGAAAAGTLPGPAWGRRRDGRALLETPVELARPQTLTCLWQNLAARGQAQVQHALPPQDHLPAQRAAPALPL